MKKGFIYLSLLLFLGSCSFTEKEAATLYGQAFDKKPYDVIIIPGIPYQKGTTNDILKKRVYWSYYLYSRGIAKNVIYSGSDVYTPYIESKVMALFGLECGIKKENIFTETKAEHSTENLYYSWKIAKKSGFKSIALASDPAQSKMLFQFAKKHHLQVDFIPMIYSRLDSITKTEPMVPDSMQVTGGFIPLPQRVTSFHRLKGTMGLNIKYSN